MSGAVSTKPYLVRAIYDWCADSGLTAYLAVRVDEQTQVPMAYVRDGEIVLNLSVDAVRNLHISNDEITCGGRFGGVPHAIFVPMAAVIGIFAKETGQGLMFQGQESTPIFPGGGEPPSGNPVPPNKPHLRVVK
ncbi:MAG: ClpXP protease specificity-enhancing factor [Nitrosomonadales bacterium]|nr:ClpXP protease specificity-enhancing factor [Nitrosomonadales bacterium]